MPNQPLCDPNSLSEIRDGLIELTFGGMVISPIVIALSVHRLVRRVNGKGSYEIDIRDQLPCCFQLINCLWISGFQFASEGDRKLSLSVGSLEV